MRNVIKKTAKLLLALTISSMFLFSCSEDSVNPTADGMPDKSTLTTSK